MRKVLVKTLKEIKKISTLEEDREWYEYNHTIKNRDVVFAVDMEFLCGTVVDIDRDGDTIALEHQSWKLSEWMIETVITRKTHPEYYL